MLEQTQALRAQVADILCELIVCGRFALMRSCQAICMDAFSRSFQPPSILLSVYCAQTQQLLLRGR